jgi:hypothetical protein
MDITGSGSQPSLKAPAEHLTGTVRIDPLFQTSESARVGGAAADLCGLAMRPRATSILLFAILLSGAAPASKRDLESGPRERLVGAWRLSALEEPGADGTVHQVDATGLLVFTADHHLSVQVMYRSPQAVLDAGAPQYAQGGYEASFGRYELNESAHSFVFHVEGALVRALVGKDLPRIFELTGSQLVVRSSNPSEHWRVVWEQPRKEATP